MIRLFLECLAFVLIVNVPVYFIGRLIGLEHMAAWLASMIIGMIVYIAWRIREHKEQPE